MTGLSQDILLSRIGMLIPFLLALSVHEWAHALAAKLLGDDTAELEGRLTLNPIAHIDPIGTIALPLLGVPVGWAKPVPCNPLRFRPEVNMTTGLALVALAGPVSNVILAAMTLPFLRFQVENPGFGFVPAYLFYLLNVNLAVFNMIPIAPLDGSKILAAIVPERLSFLLRPLQHGAFALIALIVVLPAFGIDPIGDLLGGAHRFADSLIGVAAEG